MGCVRSEMVTHPQKVSREILDSENNSAEIKETKQKVIPSEQISITNLQGNKVMKTEAFLMKQLELIHKDLYAPNIYLWIEQDIHNEQNTKIVQQVKKQGFDLKLSTSLEESKSIIKNYSKTKFRIITSVKMGEAVCTQFKKNQQIVHIYIFCRHQQTGQKLQKKWRKIKFCAVDVKQFIENIKIQSRYDNKFTDLPNFLKITNKDNTHDNTLINNSRYNLHGLFLFKNRPQAKDDFVKLAKYFFPVENQPFKSDIEEFQKDYPIQNNDILALTWYTKQTFFYGFLNNMIRSTINPLETVYLRHPFDSTFKAIKNLYDKKNDKRSLKVYRGGFINNEQLDYMEKNVGEYIQMYGFMSTSEDYQVADGFRQQYNGNSLITVLIQDQDRQSTIDYGYVSLVDYSAFPNQKQVLFNSLNVFKIISYVKQNEINRITLKYGQLARIVKLGVGEEPQKQRNIIYNYKHQQEIISKYLNHQGDVFKQCQMYENEVQYRQKIINQNERKQTIEFANQLHRMGTVNQYKADYNKALQYYKKSQKIYMNIFGENHSSIVDILNNIGIVYQYKAEYNKALQYYQRSLKIKMNLFGENHSITADILNNIGIVYQYKADYDKALQYYQRSLKVNMNILGENHSNTADTLNNIGIVYEKKSDYNKALEYYERSLKINMNILGENHSNIADILTNIGNVYQYKADYNKALQYYQRSLKIKMNLLGENHNSTANTVRNIGLLYSKQKKYAMAQSYFRRCYQIRVKIFGPDNEYTQKAMQNMKECNGK